MASFDLQSSSPPTTMLKSARCVLSDVSTGRTLTLKRGQSSSIENAWKEAVAKTYAPKSPIPKSNKLWPTPQASASRFIDSAIKSEDARPPKWKFAYKNPLSQETDIRPPVLSSRVKELMAHGETKLALNIVQKAKKGHTNLITWHTLLNELMQKGQRNLAYKTFIDMKRRGFKPNNRTYYIMIHGLWTVADLSKMPIALPLSHSLYDEYLELLRNSAEDTLERPDLRHVTTMHYFDILGRAGEFQKMFDVFYELGETGLLAPDRYVYSGLLKNLKLRSSTEKLGNLSSNEQNAADAKLVWRRFEKDIQRNNVEVDAFCITAVLHLLSYGRAQDHNYAFDIVHQHLGLALPGEDAPDSSPDASKPRSRPLPLNAQLLQSVLELCNRAGKPRLAWFFTKQAMARGVVLDDRLVVQNLLALEATACAAIEAGTVAAEDATRAAELLKMLRTQHANLAPGARPRPPVEPSNKYGLALAVCWRCKDWESACDVFTLATDLQAEQFSEEPSSRDLLDPAGNWRNINMQALTYLARTAVSTENDAHVRQCLRMLVMKGAAVASYDKYYEIELAKLIVQMVNRVESHASAPDMARWEPIRELSKSLLKRQQKVDRVSLPWLERKIAPLGSTALLDRIDKAVDFDMAVRSRHSMR